MATEIIAVYQDCVLCGVKGRQKIAEYAAKGVNIRKVSFISDEGRELCAKAVSKGIGGMPFYIQGDDFAVNIDSLITKKYPSKSKRVRKITKSDAKKLIKHIEKVKEQDNGDDAKI